MDYPKNNSPHHKGKGYQINQYKNRHISGKTNTYRVLALLVLSGDKGLMNIDMPKRGYACLDLSDYIIHIRNKLNIPVRDEWEYTADHRRFKRWWVDNVKLIAINPPKPRRKN